MDAQTATPDAYQPRQRLPFAMVPRELVECPDADPYIIAAYAALSARSNKDDKTWPSYDLLVTEAHQSRARLAKSLQWLEAHEWITVTRTSDGAGRRSVNVYELHETGQSSPSELGPEFTTGEPEFTGQSLSGELEQEPSEQEPENKNHLAAAPRINYPWILLTSPDGPFQLPDTTKLQRKRVGKLAREMNATLDHRKLHDTERGDALWQAVVSWPDHFPNATLTPEALEKHLSALLNAPLRASGNGGGQLYRHEDPAAYDAFVREGVANPKPKSDARLKAEAKHR